jgi:hypothetical protein
MASSRDGLYRPDEAILQATRSTQQRAPRSDAMDAQQVQQLDLGAVVATPSAMALLESHAEQHGLDARTVMLHLVSRHASHDWGTIDEDDAKANTRALITGARVMSTYTLDDQPIWIITDATGDDGSRQSTTLLLPGDY